MTRWRVGFVAAVPGDEAWWHRFMHRFVHVWAARRMAPDRWWWVEWTPGGLICGVIASAPVREASLRADLVVAWAEPNRPVDRARLPQFGTHCASVAAAAVRVKVAWATPWRLSRALQEAGGRPLLRRPMEG